MSKREWLQAIVSDVESLTDMSKSHPGLFDKIVSDQELEQLEGLTSGLAANIETRVNENDEDKRSFILMGDGILG